MPAAQPDRTAPLPTAPVLALDQGTTSTRAILFDDRFSARATVQIETTSHYPQDGWVEQDAEQIWRTAVTCLTRVLAQSGVAAASVAGLGITNQRETTVLWDRTTGAVVGRAIVWQDRRTAALCARLRADGAEAQVTAKTGLLLDPYFSATKLAWMLDNIPGARARAVAGDLAFGTIDSFLIYRLTGGAVHATDTTNASRTLLYDIHRRRWDGELLRLFDIPEAVLPRVLDTADAYGTTEPSLFGAAIPIRGVAGDQQAALIGQACFAPGMVKATFGTGCFALVNTGAQAVQSSNRLLTTIAYTLDGQTAYALEGAIFVAGAAVQWLRDGLGVITDAGETGPRAERADPGQDVILVPAFTGLGAPHWDAEARGALYGLTRATGPDELARAALEAVCFQTRDLIDAMAADLPGARPTVLRADGGMVASDWTLQRLADLLAAPVDRPEILETTALGAAWLAGAKAGVWPGRQAFADRWRLDRRFEPRMAAEARDRRLARWRDAVRRTVRAPTAAAAPSGPGAPPPGPGPA